MPNAQITRLHTSALLSQNLTDIAVSKGNTVGICAPDAMAFKNASLYDSPQPKPAAGLFVRKRDPGRTYEEAFYAAGMLDAAYLKADAEAINSAISSFHPDLIINIGRPLSCAAANAQHIPCWSVVHAGMYRGRTFPRICLNDLNSLLSQMKQDQILRLSDLYRSCDRRITFSPASIQPFADMNQITRIGGMSEIQPERQTKRHLAVYLSRGGISPAKLKQMILQGWKGAPYHVTAWVEGTGAASEENVSFTAKPVFSALDHPDAVIHDGNEYIYSQCLMRGIPQVVITDGTWRRSWDANAAARIGFGVSLNENVVSMASLYESYRRLMSDDWFRLHAESMRDEYRRLGSLASLFDVL
ncbi:MAG: hypothetical protein EOM64_09935 [Erysipelotrichia bacterium]|nr:hypothetical protein [Erysipelotrichia bacterium]